MHEIGGQDEKQNLILDDIAQLNNVIRNVNISDNVTARISQYFFWNPVVYASRGRPGMKVFHYVYNVQLLVRVRWK